VVGARPGEAVGLAEPPHTPDAPLKRRTGEVGRKRSWLVFASAARETRGARVRPAGAPHRPRLGIAKPLDREVVSDWLDSQPVEGCY